MKKDWNSTIGCLAFFSDDAKLHIITGAKVNQITRINGGDDYMVVHIKPRHVLITRDQNIIIKIAKGNTIIHP